MPETGELTAIPADPLIGIVVGGRYRILDIVGRGGMGAVYRAEHVKMGKVVAVKILSGELSSDSELPKRFKREAETASRLTAINTVQVFDFGSDRGMMYLVMEYVDGTDLAELLRVEGPLPFERSARILMQVANALSEAHQKGIVHRDLKPANILIGAQGEEHDFVKVADFGLATLKNIQRTKITKQGTLVGTPYYMSPEHIRGQSVDERADIYALGAVLFKLLTNETPFKAPTMMGVITKHLTEIAPPPSEMAPDLKIPPQADAVCLKAMQKEPQDRYATAAEMKLALKAAIGKDPTENTADATAPKIEQNLAAETINIGVRQVEVGRRSDFEAFEKRRKWTRMARIALVVLISLAVLGGGGIGLIEYLGSDPGGEREPNNTPHTANSIIPGRAVKGYINPGSPAGDIDWYRIDAPKTPFAVSATVTGLVGIDLKLALFSPILIDPLATGDANGNGKPETLYAAAAATTPVYLAVEEVRLPGAPASPPPNTPYSLVYQLYEATGLELEPNGDPATATALTRGVPVGGQLVKKDVDWFSLAGGGKAVQVSCSQGLDIMLTIVSSISGNRVTVNSKGSGEAESAVLSPQGDVYIAISEVGGSAAVRSTRGYQILVQ